MCVHHDLVPRLVQTSERLDKYHIFQALKTPPLFRPMDTHGYAMFGHDEHLP